VRLWNHISKRFKPDPIPPEIAEMTSPAEFERMRRRQLSLHETISYIEHTIGEVDLDSSRRTLAAQVRLLKPPAHGAGN
jgi:hypothetical protein